MKEETGAQLYFMVCKQQWTQLYLMVGTQLLVAITGIAQPPSFSRDVKRINLNNTTGCLFLCLQNEADALSGMAKMMSIKSNLEIGCSPMQLAEAAMPSEPHSEPCRPKTEQCSQAAPLQVQLLHPQPDKPQ
jgi:hypothetical protein